MREEGITLEEVQCQIDRIKARVEHGDIETARWLEYDLWRMVLEDISTVAVEHPDALARLALETLNIDLDQPTGGGVTR